MSVVSSIETAIEGGASFLWRITPGKVWVMLGLIGALSVGFYGFVVHERNVGYNKAHEEDREYTKAIQSKLDTLPLPDYQILDDSINVSLPPVPATPDCAPVDLARLRKNASGQEK